MATWANKINFKIFSILIIGFLLFSCEKIVFVSDLPGDIIMPDIFDDGTGILIINPQMNKIEQILKGERFSQAEWSIDKQRIILFYDGSNSSRYSVVEYDMKKKTLKPLLQQVEDSKNGLKIPFKYVHYVPDRNSVSYILPDNYKFEKKHNFINYLHIYNFAERKDEKLLKMDGPYSWNQNGSSIYYRQVDHYSNSVIYRYNILTKIKEKLFEGFAPVCSHNGQYIAYSSKHGGPTVKDLKTGEEWTTEKQYGENYHFSPDNRYVIMIRKWNELNIYTLVYHEDPGALVVYWEFKTGKTGVFIYDIYSKVRGFDWR